MRLMANYLPPDWIEEVRLANDIVEVVSEYLPLKPRGKGFFGLCPFHNEKTPSFHVDPEKQLYYCFGCGVGGNVINYIMDIEKLEFVDAVKWLAERKGIALPDSMESKQGHKKKEYIENLYKLQQSAARYYYNQLFNSNGKEALSYLISRGLDKRTIKTFGLGYAPNSWNSIIEFLTQQGYERNLIIKSGLAIENKGRIYDRFRNRVIFPIIDHRDRVVGFGGRILGDGMPKYLNSPDSPVFDKSNTLFGINIVKRQRPIDSIIVVEGYMDVITLHQFGIKNAVASLGTSLTEGQARLLRRYTKDVYIAYDGDSAGQQATLRGLDILNKAGCKVRVIRFPEGMDPDELLRTKGREYFFKLIDTSLSLVEYKLDCLQKELDLNNEEEKVFFATRAAEILADVENLLERDVYIQKINSLTGFKPELLYRQIRLIENKRQRKSVKINTIGNNRHVKEIKKAKAGVLITSDIKAERSLVCLMAQNKRIAKEILGKLEDIEFVDVVHRQIKDIILYLLEHDKEVEPAQILSFVKDQSIARQMAEIFNTEMEYDNIDKYISDCIEELVCRELEAQRQKLMERITRMEQQNSYDPDEYKRLLEEMATLTQRVKMGRKGKEEVV